MSAHRAQIEAALGHALISGDGLPLRAISHEVIAAVSNADLARAWAVASAAGEHLEYHTFVEGSGLEAQEIGRLFEAGSITPNPDATLREFRYAANRWRAARLADGLPMKIRSGDGVAMLAQINELLQPDAAPLEALDMGGLLATATTPRWLAPPYLAEGAPAILGGSAGAGKTWVALDLLVAAATGGKWLGQFPIRCQDHRRVLWIDGEQSPALVARRVRELLDGRRIALDRLEGLPIRFVFQLINLLDAAARFSLFSLVADFRPDLVIFDALVRFAGGADLNAAENSARLFEAVSPIWRDHGAAVLFLHHLRKGQAGQGASEPDIHQDRLRGSGDLAAAVDSILVLDRTPGGLVLRNPKNRQAPEAAPVRLELDIVDGTARITAIAGPDAPEEIVLDALVGAGGEGLTRPKLKALLEAAGSADADRLTTKILGRLKDQGRVRSRKEGRVARLWAREHAPGDLLRGAQDE